MSERRLQAANHSSEQARIVSASGGGAIAGGGVYGSASIGAIAGGAFSMQSSAAYSSSYSTVSYYKEDTEEFASLNWHFFQRIVSLASIGKTSIAQETQALESYLEALRLKLENIDITSELEWRKQDWIAMLVARAKARVETKERQLLYTYADNEELLRTIYHEAFPAFQEQYVINAEKACEAKNQSLHTAQIIQETETKKKELTELDDKIRALKEERERSRLRHQTLLEKEKTEKVDPAVKKLELVTDEFLKLSGIVTDLYFQAKQYEKLVGLSEAKMNIASPTKNRPRKLDFLPNVTEIRPPHTVDEKWALTLDLLSKTFTVSYNVAELSFSGSDPDVALEQDLTNWKLVVYAVQLNQLHGGSAAPKKVVFSGFNGLKVKSGDHIRVYYGDDTSPSFKSIQCKDFASLLDTKSIVSLEAVLLDNHNNPQANVAVQLLHPDYKYFTLDVVTKGIRIHNLFHEPVDIGNWELKSESGTVYVIPHGTIIQPCDMYVVGSHLFSFSNETVLFLEKGRILRGMVNTSTQQEEIRDVTITGIIPKDNFGFLQLTAQIEKANLEGWTLNAEITLPGSRSSQTFTYEFTRERIRRANNKDDLVLARGESIEVMFLYNAEFKSTHSLERNFVWEGLFLDLKRNKDLKYKFTLRDKTKALHSHWAVSS
eukprot:TRINITY_DN1546_c0_g2_i2.p1 TRINITY_DN1546_c0_g2~~TRINITY_DN1546_c0_g2_i2.p1  ORF type:complete len:671 (+),score=130.96 TRINITY_DN1546_c0_g2_i2:35-2014(+)